MVSELSATGAIPSSVVAAAVSGDAVAFARIVQAHHNDMARVCRVVCGDVELAQDATQAAWPIAWRRLHTLRDPEKLRPWLVSIAVNEARKLVKRRHSDRIVALEVADVGSDRHDPALRAADTDLLEAIKGLAPDDRALLAMRFVAGFDATEIGSALGLSSSGVRSRLLSHRSDCERHRGPPDPWTPRHLHPAWRKAGDQLLASQREFWDPWALRGARPA